MSLSLGLVGIYFARFSGFSRQTKY